MVENQVKLCYHCKDNIQDSKPILYNQLEFCCNGCVSVYQMLNKYSLCEYYQIDEVAGARPVINSNVSQYDYLDDSVWQYKLNKFTSKFENHVVFYIPQIHCKSCLWLLEKLYKLNNGILYSEVLFEQKEIFVKYNPNLITLKELVILLSSIGYAPYISKDIEYKDSTQANRREYIKLGVLGFCFANTMMISLPDYLKGSFELEALFVTIFPFISFFLSLPVLYYTIVDYISPAFLNAKKGVATIDLLVSIAVLVTFCRSIYEWYNGISFGYFDSMSGIVFFLAIGRWLQSKTYTTQKFDRNFKSFFPISVERIMIDSVKMVPIEEISTNDLIKIYHNEIVPVDSILSKGEAWIDYSFVNGESIPQRVKIGELVYAGGKQTQGAIELIVSKTFDQSYLTSLWNHQAFNNEKSKLIKSSNVDFWAVVFTWSVLVISLLSAGYWISLGQMNTMWDSLTTILIVACPCALLLTSSFVGGRYLSLLSSHNVYFRSADVLSDFEHIDHIVFDKTGTLTHASQLHVSYSGQNLEKYRKQLVAILSHSNHVLSKAIIQYLGDTDSNIDVNYKEHLGAGIEAWVDDMYFKLGSDQFCGQVLNSHSTNVHLIIDNQYIGSFSFRNVYRNGIVNLIQSLKSNFKLSILSGDNSSEAKNLSEFMPIDSTILFGQNPNDKLNYIQNLQNQGHKVLMVGDGLNDAGAFGASTVAIALTEKNNFFNPSSDVIMDSKSLDYLYHIIQFVKSSKRVSHIIFIYSLIYNVVGLFFALRGALSPLIAAILMPLSSLTIIALVYLLSFFYYHKYLK